MVGRLTKGDRISLGGAIVLLFVVNLVRRGAAR